MLAMFISILELATQNNGEGLFMFVERQARGGFRIYTFRASMVVDGAVSSHNVIRERCGISVIDYKLVDGARPFGILCMPSTLLYWLCKTRSSSAPPPTLGLCQRIWPCLNFRSLLSVFESVFPRVTPPPHTVSGQM
ncbi:hypothetical protein M405DRAFT_867912 [Rhizopogon salebrosus TDB-379]|nr:hypothetical protein M405DRAFT_867912 [Rhizopogon salebrosus TDB-379]